MKTGVEKEGDEDDEIRNQEGGITLILDSGAIMIGVVVIEVVVAVVTEVGVVVTGEEEDGMTVVVVGVDPAGVEADGIQMMHMMGVYGMVQLPLYYKQ